MPRVVEVPEWLAEGDSRLEFLIGYSLLPIGGAMTLYGAPESGKSLVTLQLAFELSVGRPWLGVFATRQGRTLYIETEMTARQTKRRAARMLRALGIDGAGVAVVTVEGLKVGTPLGDAELDGMLLSYRPDLLVIDSLLDVFPGGANNQEAAGLFYASLNIVRARYGCAIVLVAHARKTLFTKEGLSTDAGLEELLGSMYHGKWPDTIIRLGRGKSWSMRFDKIREGSPMEPLPLALDEESMLFTAKETVNVRREIQDLLKDGAVRLDQLRQHLMALGVSESTVNRAVWAMRDAELIVVEEDSTNKRHKVVSLLDATRES